MVRPWVRRLRQQWLVRDRWRAASYGPRRPRPPGRRCRRRGVCQGDPVALDGGSSLASLLTRRELARLAPRAGQAITCCIEPEDLWPVIDR